ncbi:MAG: S-methyl-5-thioribose-1-phosphate isomerase [Myxococcales bacterium]|nr:S-methyl-5-thioribose-1-phosphate isomerase [Myxococcales bacterium]
MTGSSFSPIAWDGDAITLIDQRRLPAEEVYFTCATWEDAALAIREMVVRGAPAIGITAAYGVVLAARAGVDLEAAIAGLAATRPTAVNLFWALDRMRACRAAGGDLDAEARAIQAEDRAMCEAMGAHGAPLLPPGTRILTHCNAGALATGGHGTALGVIRTAHAQGRIAGVYADETRPYLQGARLTAWELQRDGVPVTVLPDVAAGHLMQQGRIDAVIVGTDRVAANGDVANKIGTYTVAVLAHAHGIPFYVAGPTSTIDLETPTGAGIPIEQRTPLEVTHVGDRRLVPVGVPVENPAFDVTPARLVTALITEHGVIRPPFAEGLAAHVAAADDGRRSPAGS